MDYSGESYILTEQPTSPISEEPSGVANGVAADGIPLGLYCKCVKIKSPHLAYGRVDFLVSFSPSHVWGVQGTAIFSRFFALDFTSFGAISDYQDHHNDSIFSRVYKWWIP